MLVVALIFASLAAILHGYIFVLESVLWEREPARRVFGTTAQSAAATKELAFNQGFYNLILALLAAAGVVIVAAGSTAIGLTLVIAGVGGMAIAAVVLLVSSPDKRRAALTQLATPGLALLALGAAALLR